MSFPFFAIEGCDGVGKSTIRNLLIDSFRKRGIRCIAVGQHSWLNPWAARLIIEVRERRRAHELGSICEAYFNDKREHANRNILPSLDTAVVLSDRYFISDAVYQEVLYDIPANELLSRHHASGTLLPNAVIFVRINGEEAYRRILNRGKHRRHYERPAQMHRIMKVYKRVLITARPAWLPPILEFDNSDPDVKSHVEDLLMPQLMKFLSSRSPTP